MGRTACRWERQRAATFPGMQDTMANGDDIQAALARETGRRTVPNVFVGGKSIGGGDDTVALDRAGELSARLTAAGAL
jgi:glutaredoxin 3